MIEKKQEELEISAKIKQEKDRERQLEKANEQAKYVVESWKTSGSSVVSLWLNKLFMNNFLYFKVLYSFKLN